MKNLFNVAHCPIDNNIIDSIIRKKLDIENSIEEIEMAKRKFIDYFMIGLITNLNLKYSYQT